MAGAKRAHHQVERFRQLFFEFIEALARLWSTINKRRGAEQQSKQQSKRNGLVRR